jgi:hypothetical protein
LLSCRLLKEGLPDHWVHSTRGRKFIDGSSAGQLSATVAAIKKENRQHNGPARRRRVLMELLQIEGEDANFFDYFMDTATFFGCPELGCPEVEAYIQEGTGTARKAAAAYEARRDAEQQCNAREQRVRERLEAEQMPAEFRWMTAVGDYIRDGTGSEEAAMQAARAKHSERLASEQRRANIRQRLMAEGIVEGRYAVPEVASYIKGEDSEDNALAAAMCWHERYAELETAAEAAGPLTTICSTCQRGGPLSPAGVA